MNISEEEKQLRLAEQASYLAEIEALKRRSDLNPEIIKMMLSTQPCLRCKRNESAPGHAYCLECQFNQCRHRNVRGKQQKCPDCGENVMVGTGLI